MRLLGCGRAFSPCDAVARCSLSFTVPFAATARGRLPEWPKGAVCKTVGSAYPGSNPGPATTSENGLRPGNSPGSRAVVRCVILGHQRSGRRRRTTVVTDIWRTDSGLEERFTETLAPLGSGPWRRAVLAM
jgi:hypothetical protein